MDTKCKELAKALHTAAQASQDIAGGHNIEGLTDSYDQEICEVAPNKFVFGFDKYIDKPGTRKGRHAEPLGHIVYTITVEAEYQPFDDEERVDF